MRKLVLFLDAGMVGTETAEAYLVPEHLSQKHLDDFAWQRACEHAEMYGIYPIESHDSPEELPEDGYDGDDYSEDIEGYFVQYNKEAHDNKLLYGAKDSVEWLEM